MTKVLEDVLERVPSNSEDWDVLIRRQLEWAIENTRGNAYLNYSKYFLAEPHLSEGEGEERKKYRRWALKAFQKCEMLMPVGVETLTNLATALSELSREAEARKYLERAIELNAQYEYGYYRLAQSWEKEDNRDKVIEVLNRFPTPGIAGFKKLYEKYLTESAQA